MSTAGSHQPGRYLALQQQQPPHRPAGGSGLAVRTPELLSWKGERGWPGRRALQRSNKGSIIWSCLRLGHLVGSLCVACDDSSAHGWGSGKMHPAAAPARSKTEMPLFLPVSAIEADFPSRVRRSYWGTALPRRLGLHEGLLLLAASPPKEANLHKHLVPK